MPKSYSIGLFIRSSNTSAKVNNSFLSTIIFIDFFIRSYPFLSIEYDSLYKIGDKNDKPYFPFPFPDYNQEHEKGTLIRKAISKHYKNVHVHYIIYKLTGINNGEEPLPL